MVLPGRISQHHEEETGCWWPLTESSGVPRVDYWLVLMCFGELVRRDAGAVVFAESSVLGAPPLPTTTTVEPRGGWEIASTSIM